MPCRRRLSKSDYEGEGRGEGRGERGEVRGGEAPLESEETLWAKVAPAHTWRFPDLFFLADFKSPRGISICLYFLWQSKEEQGGNSTPGLVPGVKPVYRNLCGKFPNVLDAFWQHNWTLKGLSRLEL